MHNILEKLLAKLIDAVTSPVNPVGFSRALTILQDEDFFTPYMRGKLNAHENPYDLAIGYRRLHQSYILNRVNIDRISAHLSPIVLTEALILLNQHQISSAEHIIAVIAHADPLALARAFYNLQSIQRFSSPYTDAVIAHMHPNALAKAFVTAASSGILTPHIICRLSVYDNPAEVIPIFILLHLAQILREEHLNILRHSHVSLDKLKYMLGVLYDNNMLSPENLKLVATNGHMKQLTISCAVMDLNAEMFLRDFADLDSLLVMTLQQLQYERTCALIPAHFYPKIQPIGLFREIKACPQNALMALDLFDLNQFKIAYRCIWIVQEYEGRLYQMMEQVALPFYAHELAQYFTNLQTHLAQFKQKQVVDTMHAKLHKVATIAESTLIRANERPPANPERAALLVQKQAQFHALKKLMSRLSGDAQIITADDIALLVPLRSVQSILNANRQYLRSHTELIERLCPNNTDEQPVLKCRRFS